MSLSLFERMMLGEAVPTTASTIDTNNPNKKKNPPPTANNPQQDNNEPPDFTATDQNDEQEPNQNDPIQPPEEPPTQDTAGADSMTPPEEPPADDMGAGEGDMGTGEEGTGEEQPPEEMPEGGETELQAPGEEQGDDLKSAEQELFADLGPDKLAIKTEELKNRFKDLYDSVNGSLDKLNKISRTTDDADEIDFLVRKLLDIRDLTRDGLLKAFATKTYVENQLELKRLIALYGAITSCFTSILHRRGIEQAESNKTGKTRHAKLDPLSGFTKTYDVQ